MASPRRVLLATLTLPLLLLAAQTDANSPLEDPELDMLLEPSPVAATAVAASEDTRLLQDVYENSVSRKTVTQEPQPTREQVEEVVTTRTRGGKRRRNRKKKKEEARATEAAAVTTTTVAATLTAEVTTGLEKVEAAEATATAQASMEEELVVDAPRISYSRAWVNKSYKAKEEFNPRGMEHLYLITNLFLHLVHREREVPRELESLVAQELQQVDLDKKQGMRIVSELEANWDVLLIHYIGLVALVVLGALIVVVMPLAGLFFACCRCAGRCGAQEPHYDKKRDPCKRATLGTLLAIIVVVILLGLVCSFVSNARMEEGVQSLPKKWSVSVHDTKLFFNNTDNEVQNLLVRNYRELESVLYNKLDSSGELVKSELARVTKAVAIDNLTAIASSLSVIKQDLGEIKNTTIQLQDQTSNLRSGLEDVASRLKELYNSCESLPECRQLITKYADKLTINNDFDQLPNVESKLEEVSNLIENDIEIVVKRGKRSFDSIATEIQNKVQRSIPEIKAKIVDVGGQLEDAAEKIHRFLQPVDLSESQEPNSYPEEPNTYLRQINAYLRVMQDGINEYAMYRYWGSMGLCILLLVITLCFTLGVVFGCCGRRPDEASSCHKSTGASWLMCGVGLTFLFSAVIMTCTTVLFVVGSASEILVCDPLRDPMHSEVFSIAADFSNLEHLYPPGKAPKLTEIISKCHRNLSMHTVLSLDNIESNLAKLQDYKNRLNLHEKIAQLKRDIRVNTNVEILSQNAKEQLWDLANSSVADKDTWTYYTDILEKKVLTIDLMELAALLNQTAGGHHQVSVKLKNGALFLEGLQRWVTSIGSLTRDLKRTTARLNEHLKFNKTSLREAIVDLISQAEFAQYYLQVNGSREVTELVERFSEDFLADVDEYVHHVQTAVENDVGRCGPVSTIYNATTSAVCKDIMYPFNGFWASVGWVFFFFIPAMILAVHLSSLYRKTEPYPGPLNESSAYDKKQRRRSREHEGYVSSSYTADQPYSGSRASPPRNEYINTTDWADYPPSGGPPRYTSQPSLSPEYERPPPYYYPGPGPQYYGGPPPGAGPAAGGMQVHPPPPGNPPPGPQGPTNFIHGPAPWNPQQRTINLGGWKISPAYSRDEYDA
ncbi:hypothetical protein O3P69_011497 [Scylla paramamosain]|uniref:Prominin-like protein n=1 Tax=Scylla paramamosain TaxID=85552 RepID=A0AAW0T8B0_SCYPA